VPFQAVDGCARPGPCGGIGFTQGLSGLKRAFEFPMPGIGFTQGLSGLKRAFEFPMPGIGFTQGLSGLKRAFEFPMLPMLSYALCLVSGLPRACRA
jgi:hypothetical protein